jgi:WD40 repeat protein/predicted Ser/Thr protein kinase
MSENGQCPSVNDWRQFVLGQTSEAEAEQLERHLTACKECLDVLHGLRTEDTLVAAVRGQRGAHEPESVVVSALIARLESRPPPEAGKHPDEITAALNESPACLEATLPPASGSSADTENQSEIFECLAPAQAEDEIGRLGSYRVLRLLGVGGMGVVFLAEDAHLQRLVALKTMLPSLAVRASARQRFLREARAAARIEHEHVIPIFQVSEDRGVPFLAMPYLKGEPLDDRIKREGRLPLAEVLRIGREIAEGLGAAHEHGVIHRDIKPGNIWLEGGRGRVKILDFGLAWAGADGAHLTQLGVVLGTPAFMPPEQINGQAVDARSDLFSLGCILYRLTTGKLPFTGRDTLATLAAVGTETPKTPRTLWPNLPPALDELIMRLLAKAPEERPPSAAVVVEALLAIEADPNRTLVCPLPAKAKSRPSGKRWRAPGFAALAAASLAVILGAAALLYVATDRGEIEIYTDDPAVEVVVRKNGAVVEIVDLRSKRRAVLHSGEYTLSLAGDPQGLQIDLPDTFTLRRGDQKIVTVRRASPAPKPEVLHSIAWVDAEQGINAFIWQTGISADGKLFFGAGDAGPSGTIRIFDVAAGKQVQRLRPGPNLWYNVAAFVPGGKYLAAAYKDDKDLYLWDVARGKIVRKFTGHTDLEIGLAVSPDGKRILSWGRDATLRLWDVETGKELKKLEGHADKAEGVFSPDGKKILTFSPDKTLRLWDVETGKGLKMLEGHDDACYGSFSPDGKQVLSFSPDKTIRLWDVESGKELRRFEGAKSKDGDAGFAANGRLVVGHCDQQLFRVWETASGKLVREIDLSEMGGDFWTMTATPDGRLGLVSHSDGSVRVFDLAAGTEIHRYDDCPKARGFSFTADGKLAVAGSFRRGLFVFRLPVEKLVKP